MTTKHDVIAAHRAHPRLNSTELAWLLGCSSAYVRATAQRNRITLPGAVGRRPARVVLPQEIVEALHPFATVRGLTAPELALRLVERAAHDGLVDAVLDDEVAA